MPRERRVQAEAGLGERYRARSSPGTSPWLVIGIVLLAASLLAVGAMVVLSSIDPSRLGVARPTDPTPAPTPARPTPGVFTVGRQDQPAEGGPTPTTIVQGAAGAPAVLQTPNTGPGQPIFSPLPPPAVVSSGSGAPPAADTPAPASPAASEPSPDTAAAPATGAGPSPATAGSPATTGSPAVPASPLDQAVADAQARLTTDEDRVGQLLLLGWIGDTAEKARPELAELRAGGIVFVQNATTATEARTINQGLKQIANDAGLVPPLIAIDHEGGIVQRIQDVPNLGNNWDFAARGSTEADACKRGLDHAQILQSLGFSVNLAPVLDVNNNPSNPVIGKRSYSDDPQAVATLGAAYIRGLQGGGIAAVGKHFPGHGNTSVDSHLGLPSLPQSVDALERIELVPFRRAVDVGVAGIMSAHIVFPAVDPSGVPATLSRNVMTGLLRDSLGFKGLALSDDMGAMKAITDNYAPGDAAVRAVKAGVDMMILSAEVGRQRQARDGLLAAVQSGEISRDRLDQAVRNVLTVKARYGLLPGVPAQVGGGCP